MVVGVVEVLGKIKRKRWKWAKKDIVVSYSNLYCSNSPKMIPTPMLNIGEYNKKIANNWAELEASCHLTVMGVVKLLKDILL